MLKPALTLLLCLSTAAASAQSSYDNFLLEDTLIHSGSGSQFEPAQHDYCAAVVKGGAPACLVFSVATFGESNRYFTMLPFSSFIHYDQGRYTDKGMTPDEARALSARRSPPVVSNHESALHLERDLSFLAPNEAHPLSLFTEYRLRPGASAAFLQAVRDAMLPAAKKSGIVAFEVLRTTLGESPDRIFVVTRFEKFADLDAPDPIQAHMTGPRRIVFQNMISHFVEHIDTYVMRYRADISAVPPPAK
jgi:quinol monooxygenase YgiN